MVGVAVYFKAFSEHLDSKTLDINNPPKPSALLTELSKSCLMTSTANSWITPPNKYFVNKLTTLSLHKKSLIKCMY